MNAVSCSRLRLYTSGPMTFKKLKRAFLFGVALVVSTLAESASQSHRYFLGAGVLSHNAGKVATDASAGTKPYWSELYTQVSLEANFGLTTHWMISPDFHYTYPYKSTPESKEKTSIYTVGLRGIRRLSDRFDFQIGPGVLFYKISGDGGTQTLNNGAGTTVFGIPSGSSTAANTYLNLGLGINFSRYRLESAVLITSVLSSSRRALNPIVTLSMGF